MRIGGVLLVLAWALACASCAPCGNAEETTPRGFVMAPSAPADAGALTSGAVDAGK